MPLCEFCPGGKQQNQKPDSGLSFGLIQLDEHPTTPRVTCKQNALIAAMARSSGLPAQDVKQMVCVDGTDDQRAMDCQGFNNLQIYGQNSQFAAADPGRLP